MSPIVVDGQWLMERACYNVGHQPLAINRIAGVGIEPTLPGSEPSIATSSDNPAGKSRAKGQESRAGEEVRIFSSGTCHLTLRT